MNVQGKEVMEYCISALLSQGVTSVPQWGQGHPNERKDVAMFERSNSTSSSGSWASAEGLLLIILHILLL